MNDSGETGRYVRDHCSDDLDRVRMALAEVVPDPTGLTRFMDGLVQVSRDVPKRAAWRAFSLAGIAGRCWSCFNSETNHWDGCLSFGTPFVEDCGVHSGGDAG